MWFFTERESAKIGEIADDDHVNVTLQSRSKFVSLSGKATVVEDRRKVDEFWSESCKVWFPGGKDDPSLVLLHVQGGQGEYWDTSGTSGIKYLLEAGRAYLTGNKPEVTEDPKLHGKVLL